ncbi:MAG: carbohydrate ABC transporter permease [Clostridiaceae bacterium]|nr:carbohydrate ABC transporter permease [Clostridiaceae bacterium]
MKNTTNKGVIIRTFVLAILAIAFIAPLIWMVLTSLKSTNEVFAVDYRLLPSKFRWDNYVKIWTDETVSMTRAYGNTLFISIISVIGHLVIAAPAAYAFAKIDFKGKNFIFMLFLASMMIPAQVTIIPRFMLFRSIGLYNNLWAVILPGWFSSTAIFMLRQFYIGLPNDLMEAAKIDGAGHMRIFAQILMPLTVPAMVSLIVLAFVLNWNEYLNPLIFLVKEELYTISMTIRWYMLDDLQRYELTMAAATSSIVPIVILFIAGQKYFVEGIATSGVKG